VFGYEIISAFITVSRGVSIWYMALGFMVEWWWFLTETFARCSKVVPYFRLCPMPASANSAGMVWLPIMPSRGMLLSPPPPHPASQGRSRARSSLLATY